MSLVYFERLIDLGDTGLLALTLGSSRSLPLPAERHGYARWHDAQGAVHDRLEPCTRALPEPVVAAAAQAQRAGLAGAVPAVLGRIDWVAEHVQGGYREAPSTAVALDERLVLLLFTGLGSPQLLRVVDVPTARVVAEETLDALCGRLDIQPMLPGHPFEAVLHGAGGGWIALWPGRSLELLCLRDGLLQRAAPPQLMARADRHAFTRGTWFVKDYQTSAVRVLAAPEGTQRTLLNSAHARGDMLDLAAAARAERCLLSHPGGVIEWIDENGGSLGALRPFPAMSRKDHAGVSLTAHGRLALCAAPGREAVVVDLEAGRQAVVQALPCDDMSLDRMRFEARWIYRGAQELTDRAWLTLHRGELQSVSLDALAWEPALRPGTGHSAASATARVDDASWRDLRRPALALGASPRGKGLSRLYGRPHLAHEADWPRHEGRPMLLLCQIDLPATAKAGGGAWPAEGGLLFFAAADEEGEVLLDDCFNPAAWRVVWTASLTAQPLPLPDGACELAPACPLRLQPDAAQWPQPDAPIVDAQGWPAERLERYRQFVDEALPDGPALAHRLGGYPTVVQHNDLELDAAFADGRQPAKPTAWRLLLQLNSDDTVMWGTDSGLLYVLIHEEDLAARDFSRTQFLTQGS